MIGPLLATMYALHSGGSVYPASTNPGPRRRFRDDWDQRRIAFRKRVARRRAANRRAKVSRRVNRGGR